MYCTLRPTRKESNVPKLKFNCLIYILCSRWYLMDSDNAQLPPVPTWKWILRIAVLLFQVKSINFSQYFFTMFIKFSQNI